MPSDQIVLVVFCREYVYITGLTRDLCDPGLRQANPYRGRELYEAGQCPPLLRTTDKHYPS